MFQSWSLPGPPSISVFDGTSAVTDGPLPWVSKWHPACGSRTVASVAKAASRLHTDTLSACSNSMEDRNFDLGSRSSSAFGATLLCCTASAITFRRHAKRRRQNGGIHVVRFVEDGSSLSASSASGVSVTDKPENQLMSPDLENLEIAFKERAEQSLLNVGRAHKEAIIRWNDPDWKYFDLAMINVRGGSGGHGCKSFRREKNVPLGGPDGGNGGNGGHVYLKCIEGKFSLNPLKVATHFNADNGLDGKGKELHGSNGDHRIIPVPPGTVVYVRDAWLKGQPKGLSAGENELVCYEDIGTRHVVGELTKPGQMLRVARGGKGGRGNKAFKTQKDNAPWLRETGEKGMQRWIEVELKLIAEIGIIGLPNAGKSSLLAATTAKQPKVAPYPFTTVVPNLGYYRADEHGGVTLCDVPGLIEGASEGRGMGFQFLRHIERCRTLIHVVDGSSSDPLGDFDCIQEELRQYSTAVASKPQVVVVNKCDIPEVQEFLPELMKGLRKRCGHSRVFDISVATRYNVDKLMERVYKWHKAIVLKDWEATGKPAADAEYMVDRRTMLWHGHGIEEVTKDIEKVELDPVKKKGTYLSNTAHKATVEWDVLEEAWRLKHPEVERVAKMTDWRLPDACERFNRVCKATGITERLTALEIEEGTSLIVVSKKFKYHPEAFGRESRMLTFDLDLDY